MVQSHQLFQNKWFIKYEGPMNRGTFVCAQKKEGGGYEEVDLSFRGKWDHVWRNQFSSIGKDLWLHQLLASPLISTQSNPSTHPLIEGQEMLCTLKFLTINKFRIELWKIEGTFFFW